MPWKESVIMDQRLEFVREALSNRFRMTELCERYGVSRRIGNNSIGDRLCGHELSTEAVQGESEENARKLQ